MSNKQEDVLEVLKTINANLCNIINNHLLTDPTLIQSNIQKIKSSLDSIGSSLQTMNNNIVNLINRS